MSQSCFLSGFSLKILSGISLNRGYKGIYMVGWEGMWKVRFSQTGCSSDLTSRLGWVASSSREFKPQANGLTNLGLLSYSATVSATLQLLTCLERVHHSGGLQPWATREIQPRVPASLHKLEQFFILSHTLPLHNSHLNIRLLIAKIQANLVQNKANKMVD